MHVIYPVTVESVGTVPNLNWLTEITIKLPDGLPGNGDVFVSITLHSNTSNKARLRMQ